MSQRCQTVCGPDTYEHFCQFSLDAVISELKEQVPDIYDLFMKLANVQSPSGENSTKEVKAISALCSVLNARSSRVKGMQLLMSMMLIGRSTSKQVGDYQRHIDSFCAYTVLLNVTQTSP